MAYRSTWPEAMGGVGLCQTTYPWVQASVVFTLKHNWRWLVSDSLAPEQADLPYGTIVFLRTEGCYVMHVMLKLTLRHVQRFSSYLGKDRQVDL